MLDPKLFFMLAVGTLLVLNGVIAGGISFRSNRSSAAAAAEGDTDSQEASAADHV